MGPTRVRLLALLAATSACASARAAGDLPIQDNSFLVEEAYNQERGVIQHVSLFTRERASGDWVYAFTEEWPAPGQRHQLSATVEVLHAEASGTPRTGFGDVLLGYRWQAAGSGETAVAVAPRASLVVPAGDGRKGFGHGGVGADLGVPISLALGRRFVSHSNVGGTWIPSARAPAGDGRLLGLALGEGLVWLAHPNLNALVELSYALDVLDAAGRTERSEELLLSPGLRGALNFRSGLQIVAGVAMPIGLGPSRGERSLLGYLSFEHPITAAARR